MSKPRLQEHYETTVRPALMQEFGYTNPMQVPRLDKIVVNMGVGEAVQDSKEGRGRGRRTDRDHRPASGHHQGQAVDRDLQAAPGHADRLQGHVAAASACTNFSTG